MTDWRPSGEQVAMRQRAAILTAARAFFAARNVLEVETPILGRYATTDTFIQSLREEQTGGWLRTSPEHHMKRLLAAGAPDIYQIGKVFRAGERGRRHDPEFTMAEWYRRDFALDGMIDETCEFIATLFSAVDANPGAATEHDYASLGMRVANCDLLRASAPELRDLATTIPEYSTELAKELGDDVSAWLDLIASHLLYPALPTEGLQIVRGFPVAQAMLARRNIDNPLTADRFEIFYAGMELANGFSELRDHDEQRDRFENDNSRRRGARLPEIEIDEALLAALAAGLPVCSGVAVGIDRVLMAAGGYDNIGATLSFRALS